MNTQLQEQQSQLFKEFGVFFAFGEEQFKEQRQEGVDYCSVLSAGDCVPVQNASEFAKRLSALHNEARDKALKEKGIERIIEDELVNQETFYTGDIAPVVEVLAYYEVTEKQVTQVYRSVFHKYDNW